MYTHNRTLTYMSVKFDLNIKFVLGLIPKNTVKYLDTVNISYIISCIESRSYVIKSKNFLNDTLDRYFCTSIFL